jgi:MFS family permease
MFGRNPLGPLLMGFVAVRVGWRWIFWIMATVNGAQFIGYLFFSPETRYIRQEDNAVSATKPTPIQKYLTFGEIPGSQPLLLRDFWLPFSSLTKASVNTTALAHMVIFCFCSVLVCIEIPALLGSKFNLNFEAIGLNFIPLIIG